MLKKINRLSFRGKIAKKCLQIFIQLPMIKVNGFLHLGANYAKKKSRFKVPKNYKLCRYQLTYYKIELLKRTDINETKNLIFLLHGGAYYIGYMDIYRNIALHYTKLHPHLSVAALDYRVAPEHHYPAALEDALDAWNFLLTLGYQPNRIVIAGDSAGGNLAVALTLKLKEVGKELPRGLILMSPWLDVAHTGPSYLYNLYRDPLFGTANHQSIADIMKDHDLVNSYFDGVNTFDPFVSPIFSDISGFPPLLIQVGTIEVLESDSIGLYEKALKANVDAQLSRYEGMFHCFQLFESALPESKLAWEEIQKYLRIWLAD